VARNLSVEMATGGECALNGDTDVVHEEVQMGRRPGTG
jgi:hypothetical protein